MTGPMYQDEQKQRLAERNVWIESQLRDALQRLDKMTSRLNWTPAQWNAELDFAKSTASEGCAENAKLRNELTETKTALEEALHDAKRWRAIAEDGANA